MIKRITTLVTLIVALCSVNMSADNLWDKVKKKAEKAANEVVEEVANDLKNKDNKKNSKKSSSKKTSTKSKTNTNTTTQQQASGSIPREHYPLFEVLGKDVAYAKGTKSPKLSMPSGKSISAQSEWLDQQSPVGMMSNQRVYDEYIALQEYEKTTSSKAEGIAVRIDQLERELNKRATAINDFAKALVKAHQRQDRGVTNESEFISEKVTLKRVLGTEGYKLAIRSSLSGLEPFLSTEAKKYFNEYGSIDTIHQQPRTSWSY